MNQVVTNALQKVGNKGTYQTILGIILFFINAEANMLIFGATFIYMNPTFKCGFVEGNVDESIACPRIDQCTITSDFTIVATSGLYCDRQFQRNMVQSAFAVGAFFGLFAFLYIRDLNGRRFGMIFTQIIGIISVSLTILGGYTQSVPILVFVQFIGGFAGEAMALLVYVLPGQYCEDNFRQNLVVGISYAWAITTIMIGVLYYVYNWWYNYLIVFVLIPFIITFIITFFFLVQSPYFLHQEGLWDQYHESLRTIASYNDTIHDETTLMLIQDAHKQAQTQQQQTPFLDVICDPYYLKIILYLTLAEIGICIYYFGANYSLDLIGKDYGFNCILTGATQFIAYICLQFVVTKLPRRQGLIISCSIMSALGFLFLIPSLSQSLTAQLIIIGLNRLVGTFVFTVLVMYLTQLFPTKVQGTCMGIIDSGAQIGNFLAPIMVTVCINKQIYPLILFSVVIMLFIVIPLSLVDDSRLAQQKIKEVQQQKKA